MRRSGRRGGERDGPPRGGADGARTTCCRPESRLRQRVIDVARDAFERYGYARVVTPTFEETEVFVRGVGTSTDVVRKEMYTFHDQGGRSLSLRPEGTAPVVRAFVQHGMHKLPAAGEALVRRAHVPLRGAPGRSLPRALAGGRGGDRQRPTRCWTPR